MFGSGPEVITGTMSLRERTSSGARVDSTLTPERPGRNAGRLARWEWAWLVLGLPILIILLRIPTFLYSVIDSDESIYLLVARSLVEGHAPYTEAWENKPPGIFFLFAAAMLAFGKSIASIRILACLSILAAALPIHLLTRRLAGGSGAAGAFAALLYVVSSMGYGGTSANTEIFFIAPAAWSVYLVVILSLKPIVDPLRSFLRYLGPGLLMGLAIQIKTVAIFDMAAASLLMAVLISRHRERPLRARLGATLAGWFALGVGVTCWFAACLGYYYAIQRLDEYIFTNFIVPRAYVNGAFQLSVVGSSLRRAVYGNLLPWIVAGVALVAVASPGGVRRSERLSLALGLVWLTLTFLAIGSTGKLFGHYFLQALPPLCLLAGLVFGSLSAQIAAARARATLGFLLLAVPVTQVAVPFEIEAAKKAYFRFIKHESTQHFDTSTLADTLSDYLKTRVRPGEVIYLVDGPPVVYFLTDTAIPTKYVFSSYQTHTWFSQVLGISNLEELKRILARNPVYITMPPGWRERKPEPRFYWEQRDWRYFDELKSILERDFVLKDVVMGTEIYQAARTPG
jgi:4-amino-4-deoxy-L-arabinose transferase-like glycosyltransferase